MRDYVFFMHNDVPDGQPRPEQEWSAYFTKLRDSGAFQGGSAIGDGVIGNPVYEAGGTVEVRELPKD